MKEENIDKLSEEIYQMKRVLSIQVIAMLILVIEIALLVFKIV